MLFVEASRPLIFIRQPPPAHSIPMHRRPADTFSRQKSAQTPHRQRCIRSAMSESERVARRIHHQIGSYRIPQFVTNLRDSEIRIGFALHPTLKGNDLEA